MLVKQFFYILFHHFLLCFRFFTKNVVFSISSFTICIYDVNTIQKGGGVLCNHSDAFSMVFVKEKKLKWYEIVFDVLIFEINNKIKYIL